MSILVHEWVTGGGLAASALPPSLAAEGAAMRRAIAADFAGLAGRGRSVEVTMTLDARLPDEPGPWTVARIGESLAVDRVRELARAADFTVLIAPETTGILAGLARELAWAGARLLGSKAEAVELAADKARLAARLESLGIDTPRTRTIVPAEGLPADAEFPAVLKPVDGAGSVDTFYLADERSIPAGARAMPVALLQPYVPGVPCSASFVVGPRGQTTLIGIGTQNIVILNGRFHYRGGSLPAAWRCACSQLRPAVQAIPELRGFVGVDFIWDTNRQHATIVELNPRPTTSYVGLSRLLPPGLLAQAWLDTAEESRGHPESLDCLADIVHGQRRLSFDARGALLSVLGASE